jgi:succinoglycan biosynthesis transport protein ExoP
MVLVPFKEGEIAMQLRHYAWVIRRAFWLIILLTALTAGATYAIATFLIPPVYQASVLVQVNAAGDSGTVFASQTQAVTYALLVTNNTVLQESVAEVKTVTLAQLKQTVSASPLDSTNIIEIRAQAGTAQMAATLANVVAQNFITTEVTKVSTLLKSNLQQLTPMLGTAKNNVATAQAQLTTLEQNHASPAIVAHQVSVVESAQSNYDTLLLNYQQVQQQLLRVGNILTRVQKALPPDAPISPRTNLDTAVAAGLGLLLVLVFVLLRDWLDASLRTPEDVAHLTMLQPAGSLPVSKQPTISASGGDDGAIAQTFMVLALQLSKQYPGRCAIVVTALRPGTGVTTTAANLAVSLAQLGQRVLLIDANLRRPALHTIFHVSNQKGLANNLPGIRGPQEEMFSWFSQWTTPLPNLWLLPAGIEGAQSTAVICSPELRALMHWLLGRTNGLNQSQESSGVMDYVIFDAPSLKEGADPVTLTSFSHTTLLVAEAGKERSEDVDRAGAVFQKLGSPVLGVVINRQTRNHRPYFYVEHTQEASLPAEHVFGMAGVMQAEPAPFSGIEGEMLPVLEQKKSTPGPIDSDLATIRSRPSRVLPPGQGPVAG